MQLELNNEIDFPKKIDFFIDEFIIKINKIHLTDVFIDDELAYHW